MAKSAQELAALRKQAEEAFFQQYNPNNFIGSSFGGYQASGGVSSPYDPTNPYYNQNKEAWIRNFVNSQSTQNAETAASGRAEQNWKDALANTQGISDKIINDPQISQAMDYLSRLSTGQEDTIPQSERAASFRDLTDATAAQEGTMADMLRQQMGQVGVGVNDPAVQARLRDFETKRMAANNAGLLSQDAAYDTANAAGRENAALQAAQMRLQQWNSARPGYSQAAGMQANQQLAGPQQPGGYQPAHQQYTPPQQGDVWTPPESANIGSVPIEQTTGGTTGGSSAAWEAQFNQAWDDVANENTSDDPTQHGLGGGNTTPQFGSTYQPAYVPDIFTDDPTSLTDAAMQYGNTGGWSETPADGGQMASATGTIAANDYINPLKAAAYKANRPGATNTRTKNVAKIDPYNPSWARKQA